MLREAPATKPGAAVLLYPLIAYIGSWYDVCYLFLDSLSRDLYLAVVAVAKLFCSIPRGAALVLSVFVCKPGPLL